MLEEKTKSI